MIISRERVAIIIAFVVLFFINCIPDLTSIEIIQKLLKYIDEIIVVFLTLYVVINWTRIYSKKKRIINFWILFMLIGFVSSMIYRYQSLFPTCIDALVICNKFFVGYLAGIAYSTKRRRNISDYFEKIAKLIVCILFVIAIHDILFDPWYPKADYRYFADSLMLMFSHPTYLAAASSFLLIYFGMKNKNGKMLLYMLMASFLCFMSLRGKAIAFVGVYWFLYVLIVVFKFRHYLLACIVGGIGGVIVGFEQIILYFFTPTHYSPRQILMSDSIQLAIQHFPLGTGFGTFGSTIAEQYYSPLYTMLNYSQHYGMGPDDAMFLSDGFWPIIIAQFGIIGTILFLIVFVYFFKYSIDKIEENRVVGFAMLAILVLMAINSTAETSFFNPTSLLYFILFGIAEKHKAA